MSQTAGRKDPYFLERDQQRQGHMKIDKFNQEQQSYWGTDDWRDADLH